MKRNFDLAMVGLGPAGVGLLVAAARTGRLDALLDGGVVVYEQRTERLGGKLSEYQLAANSLADVFLESLEEPGSRELLAGLGETPEADALREWSGQYPPLPLAGAFAELVAQRVIEVLERHPACEVRLGTAVTAIDVIAPGEITVHDSAGGAETVRAGLVCCGGEEFSDSGLVETLDTPTVDGHVVYIDPASIAQADRLTVLGGSHTAWGVAARALVDNPGVQVTLVQHRMPKLYFATAAEAEAAGFAFDPEKDVCPLSGRVYRYGGLRGPARELAVRTLSGPVDRLRVVQLPGEWDRELLREHGALPADIVVPCFGYRAALPEIRMAGRAVDRATADDLVGTHGTDAESKVGLFAYGMGAGPRPNPKSGGEPSYRGRLHGVWVYQHDAGDVMVDRLTGWLGKQR
ncbi:hypothetical protein AB0E77_20185 [Streptomyces sp. NPDC032940]|uniref:hypothetical protein n=1 Tax=Streptomyces sp. NPDC032940 TaxID=3155366 RepID=UPI0033C85F1C